MRGAKKAPQSVWTAGPKGEDVSPYFKRPSSAAILSVRLMDVRYIITRDFGRPDDFIKASTVGTFGYVFTITCRNPAAAAFLPFPFFGAAFATGAFFGVAFFGVDFLDVLATVDLASSL